MNQQLKPCNHLALKPHRAAVSRSFIGHCLRLLVWLAVLASGGDLLGQTTAPAPTGTELPQDLLKSLQEFRKLQNTTPDLNLPSANSVPGEDPYQQRLRSIQQRMELIRSLVQQKQAAEEQARLKAKQNAAATQNGGEVAESADAGNHSEQTGENHPAARPEEEFGATDTPAFPLPNLSANVDAGGSADNPSKAPKYVGETVVPSAVDPLELANSLFQTGNYDLALKTYLAVADKVDKPQDAIWTDYFVASCQRILGDLPAAEKGYRTLVESRRPTRPVEAARWWLDNVERRKSIAATLNDLDASLKAVAGEANANGNKK